MTLIMMMMMMVMMAMMHNTQHITRNSLSTHTLHAHHIQTHTPMYTYTHTKPHTHTETERHKHTHTSIHTHTHQGDIKQEPKGAITRVSPHSFGTVKR